MAERIGSRSTSPQTLVPHEALELRYTQQINAALALHRGQRATVQMLQRKYGCTLILKLCSTRRCSTKVSCSSALNQSALSPSAHGGTSRAHICHLVAAAFSVLYTSGSLSAARRGTARALLAAHPQADLILYACVVARKSSASSALALQLEVPEDKERLITTLSNTVTAPKWSLERTSCSRCATTSLLHLSSVLTPSSQTHGEALNDNLGLNC